MREREIRHDFRSGIGKWIRAYVDDKQARGHDYVTVSHRLRRFDRFLCNEGLTGEVLPRELVRRWTAKRPHESASTQRIRIDTVRQFARFLVRQGIPAYVPEVTVARNQFTPRILTREEVRHLLQASDRLPRDGRAPWRHYVMPEVFRLLYGCGLRLGEILRLTGADVDLDKGVLTIRESKFGKDRLVPMAPSQTTRLRGYVDRLGGRSDVAIFFPAPDDGRYSHCSVYRTFRQLLRAAGISHGGRGRGPRVHDLRATFAVHRLETWYRQGVDWGVKLPVLATYMGHSSFYSTQQYLRLTADLFPDVVKRLDEHFGQVIPRGAEHEADRSRD
jgi:integrase